MFTRLQTGFTFCLTVLLLLIGSSSSPIIFAEIHSVDNSEGNGRSGPDADIEILSPRGTITDPITGNILNTLRSNVPVEFEVFVENVGTSDINEMSITLTIYNSVNGTKGSIAKDSTGTDLTWKNHDLICNDSFSCPWQSLAAGSVLNNGRHKMFHHGLPVIWTPITGNYFIVTKLSAIGDSNPNNDEQEVVVSVVDWTDVAVDLSWDSGVETESGTNTKGFTLNVSTEGSVAWSLRNLSLELDITGPLSSATDDNGNDISGTTQINTLGTYTMTETFRHEVDVINITNETRYVINSATEWYGYVTPDSSLGSGDYSISVSLVEYVAYGQLPDCEEQPLSVNNTNNTDPNATQEDTIYKHFCEVEFYSGFNSPSNADTIEGQISTVHDIRVNDLKIHQGFSVDSGLNVLGGPFSPNVSNEIKNPGWTVFEASVDHSGSNLSKTYDWTVRFELTDTVTGVENVFFSDNCTFGLGPEYEHKELGDDMGAGGASMTGKSCILLDVNSGIYNISATISMVGETVTDVNSVNDGKSIDLLYFFNNRPSVSLTMLEEDFSIVVGPYGTITLEAIAYDADDDNGESLSYVWSHPGMGSLNGTIQQSPCDGIGSLFARCTLIPFSPEFVGVNSYSVTVYDANGSYGMDYLSVFVWNQVLASSTTANGITMQYNLTYNGVNEFTVSMSDSESTYTKDLTEFGYAGEYQSVAVIDYAPSTTYLPEDVKDQEIVMSYDASTIEPTKVFWVSSNGVWLPLDATIFSAGTSGTIVIDMGELSQTLPQGEIVLMGGELQVIDTPDAHPIDLTVVARKGGTITAYWSYIGTIISGIDWLELEICDSAMICETTMENTSLVAYTMSGQTDTIHGETYTYTLKVCNEGGCNPTIATGSATADKLVDGNVTVTDMSVSNKAREEMWGVTWNISGDTFDISGWRVCYADYSWETPSSMPTTNCVDAGNATVVEINHPVKITKTYYFAAVAYDDKDNFIADVPIAEILYNANVDYTIVDSDMDGIDDLFDLCPDTEKGIEVDQTGCPPDSDKDGVIDSEDDCPNEFGTSHRGLQAARLLGCPDSDNDGWANSVDSFPEDPSEWFDSDDDGCGDNIDAFPGDEFECIDTDGDGYGDNTDLFPEDPEEFSDLDGDGIGDSRDECDDSSSDDKLGKNGCALTEDSSKLVESLIYGGTGLIVFATIIALVSLKLKKDSENEEYSEEWSTAESEFFSEPFEETLYNTPPSHESGIFDSDGYEWLEYPDESGVWYWRNSPNGVWSEYK